MVFFPHHNADRQIESRLHMEWKPYGLMDTEGSWFLKIPDRVNVEVNGRVKEILAKKYTVCKHFLSSFMLHVIRA